MGNRTLKAGLFAALAAGALWVLPMSAWAAPVFPEGISADGESLAGKTWEDALHTAEEKVKDQAVCIVLDTIKGQGVKYYEDMPDNHAPKVFEEGKAVIDAAIAELKKITEGE